MNAADLDPIEPLVRRMVTAAGGELQPRQVWLAAYPRAAELPPHGWKLHISARPIDYLDVVGVVVPVLLAEQVVFKLAGSIELLRKLNSGDESPATVGKAFTIYPLPDQLVPLAGRLARLLQGRQAPRILSDRRVSPGAPVYYRYGPFTGGWQADEFGQLVSTIVGPDGQSFPALAQLHYRQPDWLTDPFRTAGDQPDQGDGDGGSGQPVRPAKHRLIDGRYRIVEGIQRSVRGSVYRAERCSDGRPVVIKQARAYVGEDTGQIDARLRLRNERRVLQRLAGVPGVPTFIEHLRLGDDELLVTTDVGRHTLITDLGAHGRYSWQPAARSLAGLGQQLARILLAVHERGVVMRDLSPKNVIVAEDGTLSLVDFGIAADGELTVQGATLGYAPPSQQLHQPAEVTDDCFALGMTLLFAATGTDPVIAGAGLHWARLRALQTLQLLQEQAGDQAGLIADLLAESAGPATSALRRLAAGPPPLAAASRGSDRRPGAAAQELPDEEQAAQISEFLLDGLVQASHELLRAAERDARWDPSVHRGLAGVGLELLQHRQVPGVADLLAELGKSTVALTDQLRPPPGLRLGTTGVQVFIHELRASGIDCPDLADELVAADLQALPADTDLMIGAAGVGIGHLRLYRYRLEARHLDRARECAALLLSGWQPEIGRREHDEVPERSGVIAAAGLAHGRAGTLALLVELLAAGDDPGLAEQVAARAGRLAAEADRIGGLASSAAARPLAASWCQGLAGIARSLHRAGLQLADPALLQAGVQASEVCLNWVPYLATVGQCCGLAGVGSMLIELAPQRQLAGLPDGVAEVAAQLLRRSAGTPSEPVFDRAGQPPNLAYSTGNTGLLAFFRAMRDYRRLPAVATDILAPSAG